MRKKIVTGLVVFIVIAAAFFFRLFFFKTVPDAEHTPRVRVLLGRDEKRLTVSSESRCDVIDPSSGAVLFPDADISTGIEMFAENKRIHFGDARSFPDGIRLSFGEGDVFEISGAVYRGSLIVLAGDKGLDAVNVLGLEDYLKGVIPCELNSLWPYEVLKAQAITSRSFALSKMLRRKSRGYDLSADTYSQVYRGRAAENWRTSRAVDDTRGLVLEYNGKVVPGYFSSCCGGHTENASVVWGEKSLPPLEGVKCGWCWMSPYYRWEVRVSAEKILKGLREVGYEIDQIRDIRALETDASGRLVSLRVSSGSDQITVPVVDMRRAVGVTRMKSTAFDVKRYPRFFLFRGKGWGHGVGLCQWGAFGLALRWKKAEWILKYYYPGADIVNMKKMTGEK